MRFAELQEKLRVADPADGPVREDLPTLNAIVWHEPGDMTVKVEAGVKMSDLQSALAKAGQWLPLDPWNEEATIKRVIDENLHGPHRHGFGTVREPLIGMEMVLADGRLVASGGNVVKNVAGYDLMKLFVGSDQSLGVVVTATFKLWPLPRREVLLRRACADAGEAETVTGHLLESEACPVVLDWHADGSGAIWITTAFAGEGADVDWQLEQVASLGFEQTDELSYDRPFFRSRKNVGRRSVLPSRMREAVESLDGAAFVARAGNGTIWSEAITESPRRQPTELERRLKATFDPRGILPPIP